eukprot:487516_1
MLYVLFTLIQLATAAILERPERHNHAWKRLGRTDNRNGIDLTFALKQQNVDLLRDTLLEVSTPTSDRYGVFLTMNEIQEMVKPTTETVNTVKNWLTEHGVQESHIQTITPDFLRVSTNIGFAERLLGCHYYNYKNDYYPNTIVSRVDHAMDYQVPDYIINHLDFISPTKRFPSPLTVNITNTNPSPHSPYAAVNPAFLRNLYSVGSTTGIAANNTQAIGSFLEQYWSETDLDTFWKRNDIPTTTVIKVPSSQPSGRGIEAELDIQYITAMGEKISTQAWYTSGRAPNNKQNEPFLTWLLDIENATNPSLLYSVSYGEDEKSVGYSYGSRVNTEFAKCGTAGISFLFASGDSGAGGNCTASKGRECPDFPTGSPYVTSVGGTHSSSPEIVWSSGGGGFSDYWPQQTWQTNAINNYFTTAGNNLPAANKWNKTGRGYPDIAAQSVDFTIVVGGANLGVSGTSCATPTASGVMALLNDLRLQNGMPPLGFLNPFLYQTAGKDATALNDITSGRNTGCGGAAYPAEKGWDAASGYGTPNYKNLAKYVVQTGRKALENRKRLARKSV